MMRKLGFGTSRMRPGQGLDERGFATAQVTWQCWGVANYTQMWGRDGKAVGAPDSNEAVVGGARLHGVCWAPCWL
jgi:hypothetical protein